jgi:DNA-binding NtrC family response regulator
MVLSCSSHCNAGRSRELGATSPSLSARRRNDTLSAVGQPAFILILTGDEAHGRQLGQDLSERYGHACNALTSVADALDSIRVQPPDVVVCEPQVEGRPVAPHVAELLDTLAQDATLVVLGPASELPATRHVRTVAFDGREREGGEPQFIDSVAVHAVARRQDRRLRKSLEEHRGEPFEGIVGNSPQVRRTIERIRKVARTKLTVLIVGETGTGKELIAEAIHRQSDRARRPFKPVNCAGLNENLLESELFGHVKGAFTGAVADRRGYFSAADGGTLFLDEVGDMPLAMQAKLLRALERREITPVGSTEVIRVDVRVIAATNRDLSALVEKRQFRDDLYYRLHHLEIRVPPLRERRQDIPLLADHLLRQANREHNVSVPGFSSEAMNLLARYYWPGNVRELGNVVASLAVEVLDRQIEAGDLPEYIRGSRELVPVSAGGLVGRTLEEVERMMIERTLQATEGNREQAAKMLNIGTRTLYRKIKEFGL